MLLHLDGESEQHDTHAMSGTRDLFAHVYTGPGDYDPSDAKGYKADPKSGFLTGNRFHELEKQGQLCAGICRSAGLSPGWQLPLQKHPSHTCVAEDLSCSSAPLQMVFNEQWLQLLHSVRPGACVPADLSNSVVPQFMPHMGGQLPLQVIAL